MENEEKQKMAYESYFYRQQLGSIKKEIDKITLTMLDLVNAGKTIESLSQTDSLVPIGGNAFVEAKLSSDKILVPIGGGYTLKLNKESAKEEIDRRTESTKKVLEKLQTEYENIMGKLTEVEKKMRENTK